jgi:ATP-dependent Clp protease ATP-binding subunit ClpC
MFERYTEKARRVIFFARYEASQFGLPNIETEHLLMGLLREDKALTNRFLRSHSTVESIRKQIEAHTTIREKIPTSVDLPLSNECKRVLAYAAEEAERLGHRHIGTEHLLLGLLRQEKCFAATMLKERGLEIGPLREELEKVPHKTAEPNAPERAPLEEFSSDLTQAALRGELDPVVGREDELAGVIEILCRREHKNPILIGERGVGKRAIVEGLAQRIADSAAPSFLAEKRIVTMEQQPGTGWTGDPAKVGEAASAVARWMPERLKAEQRLNQIIESLKNAPDVILFVDDVQAFFASTSASGSSDATRMLKPPLLLGEIQCIGACTPREYQELLQAFPWLADCFRPVYIGPMDEASALRVLQARKQSYEKFHGVTYSDEALECVARDSGRYLPEGALPGKALELLDAAGSRVKSRQTASPEEIAEVEKRIKFIDHRMQSSIANHEFEKARFYSNEERKEKENLRALREKYHIDDSASGIVSREDVEEAIARWAKYPFRP